MIQERYAVTKVFFALKGRTAITRNSHKIANQLMTVASGGIKLQSERSHLSHSESESCKVSVFHSWCNSFFELSQGWFQKIRSQKKVLCTKRENWYYLKYNCYRLLRRECGIACMNLNLRTDSITLTMLEHMRLTCSVLPQGKHLMFVYNCIWNVSFT